jgi:hypothetical protein
MAGLDDLLKGSIGGTELGASPQEANALALIKAMQSSSEAGMQRTASPIGSIAQNLLPLFQIPLQAKAMQVQAQQAQTKLDNERAQLALKQRELAQGSQPRTLEEAIVQAQLAGKDTAPLIALKRAIGGGQGKTLEERAASGDPLAIAGMKIKQGEAEMAADRVTLRGQQLADEADRRRIEREQRQQETDYRKKLEGGQAAAIDPITFRKVPTASLEDDRTGKVKTLPKNDALIATQIEEGMRQLYDLKNVVPKVLPDDSPNTLMGLVTTPAHALQVKAKIARRDPDAVAFDRLRSLSKYPVIQIINKNPMRFPLAEMKDIQERGGVQDSDTQKSANVLIDQALNNLRYTAQVLGLDPTELEASIAGGKAPTPNAVPASGALNFEVPPGKENEALKYYDQMHAAGASDEEISRRLGRFYQRQQ